MTDKPYQERVNDWIVQTFPPDVVTDITERNFRFLEEAMELVQALGMSASDVLRLVQYTYGRPKGQPSQEVGGVMVCLAALCNAAGISMSQEGQAELERVLQPDVMERIRQKHAAKPADVRSPLPGYADAGVVAASQQQPRIIQGEIPDARLNALYAAAKAILKFDKEGRLHDRFDDDGDGHQDWFMSGDLIKLVEELEAACALFE